MSNDPGDQNDPHKKRKAAGRSPYAGKAYDVGKGKPPKQHQFKPGNKGGGRKRGSRNKTDFDKLMDERVVIGEDRLGRPLRKRWRDIINRQLLQKAAKGDLAAIRIVKEFELKQAAFRRAADPVPLTPAEIARAEVEDKQKRALAARLVRMLEDEAEAKRDAGPKFTYRDGKVVLVDPPDEETPDEDREDGSDS